MNIEIASSVLAKHRDLSVNVIHKILSGEARAYDILNYSMYEMIFKIRHDAIHWLICQYREIPFGEKKISDYIWNESMIKHKHYDLIKNQTPDSVRVEMNTVKIMELTVSRMKQADVQKISKYKLLVKVIKEAKYDVDLEVIVINSVFSVPDRSFLMDEHRFSSQLIDQIYLIIRNIDDLLHQVNESPSGLEWSSKFRGLSIEKVDFGISDDDVLNFYQTLDRKPFRSSDDLKDVLTSDMTHELTTDDNDLIETLVTNALGIQSSLTVNQSRSTATAKLIKHHEDNKHKVMDKRLRAYMPLPYFEEIVVDSAVRSTIDDDIQLSILFGSCKLSDDWILQQLSKQTTWHFKIRVPADQRFNIALDGPGRKKYIHSGSIAHINKQRIRKSIWYPINQGFNNEIQDMAKYLSQIDNMTDDNIPSGPGFRYILACQSIFREININALRSERRGGRFIVRPVNSSGIYVLIHPGAKLRTGENLSTVWFKVIFLQDKYKSTNISQSWIYKKLHQDKTVLYTDWLSTDANRLDHYIRCYDKILMSYACYCSFSTKTLKEEMRYPISDTLGMIIMIYMENKRSTSKMLQDVRYLVMNLLSMFNYYEDILDKFIDPIRTPLQSYLLTKIVDYVNDDNVRNMILASRFGNVNVEAGTGDTFDRLAGAMIELPRILTTGPPINFRQMLCEMYFTMLFNKNQDDPTHASFQILSKILEGEASLDYVKATSELHYGYKNHPLQDIQELIDTPHKNQFSRDAIIVASKLQSMSIYNKSNSGIAHNIASTSASINKTIDEFATFKSSSTIQNRKFNAEVYVTSKDKQFRMDEEDKKNRISGERGVQNRRRRCIEGVRELIDEGCIRSFDLIKSHLMSPIIFQIFKKNQIGGVREILILDIQKRILINILESFSRVICHEDDREMLTHGDKKVTLMRDLIRELKRGPGKKLIMNYNFDKTRWAPSFMPIQFLYMFVPFRKRYPSLFRFICISLMNHTNKQFCLPEKLIRAWRNDMDNEYKHWMDPNLQKLKENFLNTKDIIYTNESNMGQGILHYTSSYYHLCFISLRDEVYKRLCEKIKISPGQWRDLISSDDSYTAHSLPMDTKQKLKLRIHLFMKSQEVVERVMNIWTSKAKSSTSLLIHEFNSLFGSNLTMYPTTFKFTLAAVHPMNTDSIFRMVKEGYIACRQIVENGGSLELYTLASKLNKHYTESIYHTHIGGVNAAENFGLRREYIPYQLGIYPIMDPAVMIMFGPECHNYNIIKNTDKLTPLEEQYFKVMHTIIDVDDPEIYASMHSVDSVFVGVNRIEARMGPIRRLEYIKRNLDINKQEINDYIAEHPLLLFMDPKDTLELKIKVYIKLFQNSAAEALRTTAASIYYGRVAATVSANAFTIPFVNDDGKEILTTYSDCMTKLRDLPTRLVDLRSFYPFLEEYENVYKLSQIEFIYNPRNDLETQNIRLLQLNKLQQRVTNPIIRLLQHYWINPKYEDVPSSFVRDWINIKELVPVIEDSIELTLEHFPGNRSEKVKSLTLIILRLMGFSSKPMKAILYGPSSRAYDQSYLVLKQQNMYAKMNSMESKGTYLSNHVTRATDRLSFAFNIFALSTMYNHLKGATRVLGPLDVNKYIIDDEVSSFFLDNSISSGSQKKILMMLLYHGRIENVSMWSRKTRTIFYQWVMRSQRTPTGYIGDFILKTQLADVVLTTELIGKRIFLSVNKLDNMTIVHELIKSSIERTGISSTDFWKKIDLGVYLYTTETVSIAPRPVGFQMKIANLSPIKYHPGNIIHKKSFFTLFDTDGEVIMNCSEGLLHTDYTPEPDTWDIKINGMKLSKMLPLRPFNTFFSVDHCSDHDLCDLLPEVDEPLYVPRPPVSHITNMRLGITYPERELDMEFAEILIDNDLEFENEEKTTEVKVEGPDLIDSFLALDDDFFVENLKKIIDQPDQGFSEVWMDPQMDMNLLKTMTRQRITYQPKRILERVVNMKYQILTKMVTSVNMINKKTIVAAQRLLDNRFIVYSLIYTYDRQFTNTDAPSPNGCEIRLNPTFESRFKVKMQQDDIIDY